MTLPGCLYQQRFEELHFSAIGRILGWVACCIMLLLYSTVLRPDSSSTVGLRLPILILWRPQIKRACLLASVPLIAKSIYLQKGYVVAWIVGSSSKFKACILFMLQNVLIDDVDSMVEIDWAYYAFWCRRWHVMGMLRQSLNSAFSDTVFGPCSTSCKWLIFLFLDPSYRPKWSVCSGYPNKALCSMPRFNHIGRTKKCSIHSRNFVA